MVMKEYALIHFPVDKACHEMTSKEAKAHFEWFLSVIHERNNILKTEVKKVFPKWEADYTRESLIDLGSWMKQSLGMRIITAEERKRIVNEEGFKGVQAHITVEKEQKLSSVSERIRFDVGIYFGETLKKNIDFLEWRIEKRKSMADYQCPIIDKINDKPKGCVCLNPLRVLRVIALGMIESDWNANNLIKQYDFELRNFKTGYPISDSL